MHLLKSLCCSHYFCQTIFFFIFHIRDKDKNVDLLTILVVSKNSTAIPIVISHKTVEIFVD